MGFGGHLKELPLESQKLLDLKDDRELKAFSSGQAELLESSS